jgi:hypothetical protein
MTPTLTPLRYPIPTRAEARLATLERQAAQTAQVVADAPTQPVTRRMVLALRLAVLVAQVRFFTIVARTFLLIALRWVVVRLDRRASGPTLPTT